MTDQTPPIRMVTLGRFSDQHDRSELGRAQLRAAKAYGVPHAAFMVHGSTGANAVALRAHNLHRGQLRILVARGAHHSIINESIAIGGTLRFARSDLNARFEASLPPSPSQIEEALVTGPEVDLVVVTSPTYEGFHARIPEIARIVHQHGALLHVDAAWGPLGGFHPALPPSPVACGADTASISVHKLGGALSQAALLTWTEERLGAQRPGLAIRAAQLQYCTTSPSYILAASLDQAIIDLTTNGKEAIDRAIKLRDELKARLTSALPALETLEPDPVNERSRTNLNVAVDPGAPIDPTRLTIGVAGYPTTGFEVAELLMTVGIVPEKAGVQTVTMFVHIGAEDDLPARVAAAIVEQLAGRRREADHPRAQLLPNPLLALDAEPAEEPSAAMRRSLVDGVFVPFAEAAGRVCLELVEAFPPGIPIGVPGFRLTTQAIAYLTAVADAGGHVVSLNPGEILTLPDER